MPFRFKCVLMTCLLALSFCGLAEKSWIQLDPPDNPFAWGDFELAYDTARTQAVFFGGLDDSFLSEATWAWDGQTWSDLTPPDGPPALYGHAMAYDSKRQEVVLFGGSPDGHSVYGETWIWSGSQWYHLSPAQKPSPRYSPRMAFDPAREEMVLFGGWNHGNRNDTWVWDGTEWAQIFPAHSPAARAAYAIAFDERIGELIIFGGSGDSQILGDTWAWNGVDWVQKFPTDAPPPRAGAKMAFDRSTGRIILFGGYGASYIDDLNDTWAWDGISWTRLQPFQSPSSRYEFGLAYDDFHQQLVLYGGYNHGGEHFRETWVWRDMCTYFPPDQVFTFTRAIGKPITESMTWESCGGPGEMIVVNDGVSSANLYLNGLLIAGPSNFNKLIGVLCFPVELLSGRNVLEIELRSRPGSNLEISFTPNE